MERSGGARNLSRPVASLLVAFTSGAVLVLEILSLRLIAPYVGLSLETSTAVIGFALAAISLGAWAGGRGADRFPPGRALGPVIVAAGCLTLFVGPWVHWAGDLVWRDSPLAVLAIAAIAVFPPAVLLSAVTPMVVKLRLSELSETGTVVGQLSGVATLGALVATFTTGFVLIAAIPTSMILIVLGVVLVLVGLVLSFRTFRPSEVGSAVLLAVIGSAATFVGGAPCDVETAYHCARVVSDEDRAGGRTLQLDTLSHSYVDLDDPTFLGFSYMRGIASVVDVMAPQESLRALHLGGGGLTFPRYLAATRSGASSLVFEIDRGVVDLDTTELGATLSPDLQVEVRDARVGLGSEPTNTRDLVIGDAFAGLSVPWHLTTVEAIREIDRVLTDDGLYVMNVIDFPPLGFARAEVATLRSVFPHVAVIARPPVLQRSEGGNVLIVASHTSIPAELADALAQRAPDLDVIYRAGDVDAFMGDAQVLTDDYAPVDQLLTPVY